MILIWLIECLYWSMYLDYIYGGFLSNLILISFWLLHLLAWFQLGISSWELCWRLGELYMSGKASLTCWRGKCGKKASLKNFTIWYILHICCFFSDYCFFIVCQALMLPFVIFYQPIFKYPDKKHINKQVLRF